MFILPMVKGEQKRRWLQQHPDFNRKHSYYQFSTEDQVITVRLRTEHSRLEHHMLTKFHMGESEARPCGTSPMHSGTLPAGQECPTHQNLRTETWPADTPLREKVFGPLPQKPGLLTHR